MPARRTAPLVLAVAAAGVLSGCAVGQRPVLTERRKPEDPAVEAVAERLEAAHAATFTAEYVITPTAVGAEPVTATVYHDAAPTDGPTTRVVIGDVEFVTEAADQRTCAVSTGECVPGEDAARISQLALGSGFWGPSAVRRLTAHARQAVAETVPSDETVAGQPVRCATVALADANAVYCALAAGPLARYVGNDVSIELIEFTPTVDG